MLDVHPPHAPTHTWRDFLIHIATICVGLLIAIGLEQSVEAIHHHHQAQELEERLQDEAKVNAGRITESFAASDAELVWLLGLQQDVQAMLAGKDKFAYRPRPETEPGVPVLWVLPRTAVWDAARQSGIVSLLPTHRAELYTGDYLQADISYQYRTRFYEAFAHQQAFESKFATGQCPATPDLTRMSPQQLDSYSTLIGETYAAGLAAKNRLRIAEWVHNKVLREMTPQQAAADKSAAMQGHPDRFPSLAAGTPYTGPPAPPLCR
jgi:hypothetical protein